MMIPTPGGRRVPHSKLSAPMVQAPLTVGAVRYSGGGLNPLVQAANPLLDLIVPLRTLTTPPDLEALRERLAVAIKAFEMQARAGGVDSESIAAARYALCTLLDESIASTAWGTGIWAYRSLLVAFHNEASGGEKFFLILQQLSQDARTHLDLLELMYMCLALGLEGRYRMIERGPEQLSLLRERLQRLIAQQRGAFEADLSPRWRSQEAPVASTLRQIPIWVLAVSAGVFLVIMQMILSSILNSHSDPTFASLHKVQVAPPFLVPRPAAPIVASPVRVGGFLAPEIAQGLLSVKETADKTVVTVSGDGVFASGSAEVTSNFQSLFRRIGDALQPVPGKVVVIGHTDNTAPSLSARFPSNYDLSRARADGVSNLLAQRAGPATRFSAEGHGDTEPLVANDSKINRSLNRRVEIVVLTPALAP